MTHYISSAINDDDATRPPKTRPRQSQVTLESLVVLNQVASALDCLACHPLFENDDVQMTKTGCLTTTCRYDTVVCCVCLESIAVGSRMFCTSMSVQAASPQEEPGGRAKIGWGHELCYSTDLPAAPFCRHWTRLGRCPSLEVGMCAFSHPDEEKGTSAKLGEFHDRNHFKEQICTSEST